MSPEKGRRKPLREEEQAELGRQRKEYLKKAIEHNKQVGQGVKQPFLISLEATCGDCGQPMSECQCADKGVGHHPGRVPR